MGTIVHHAIIVTSWKKEALDELVKVAKSELSASVLGPSEEVINGYRTVVICPDGSKEGWGDSNIGDKRREQIKDWLNAQRHDDGSSWVEWVEVQYGNDLDYYAEAAVIDDQWRNR